MSLPLWRFVTLLLAALGMTMGAAHALEMPAKFGMDSVTYMLINRTLYKYFAVVGGAVQMTALVTAIGLCWQVRGRPSFRTTLWGTVLLGLSLVLWGALVQTVNVTWNHTLDMPNLAEAAKQYIELRSRWEYGHLAAFAAWAAGFVFLLRSVVGDSAAGEVSKAKR